MTAAIVAALAMPLSAPAASAERSAKPANAKGCWYYGEANFQGARAEIVEGDTLATLPADWNDRISSLTCHPLCTLTAYDSEGQTGAPKRFNGDLRSLGEWNDRISSMAVTCKRRTRSIS